MVAMIKFMMWYFPVKLLVMVFFLLAGAINTNFFLFLSLSDSLVLPLVVTVVNIFRRRKLRSGEYKVKPGGRRL
jgi:hypothetical protein